MNKEDVLALESIVPKLDKLSWNFANDLLQKRNLELRVIDDKEDAIIDAEFPDRKRFKPEDFQCRACGNYPEFEKWEIGETSEPQACCQVSPKESERGEKKNTFDIVEL